MTRNRHHYRAKSVNHCVADEWTAAMKRSQTRARRWKDLAIRMATAVREADFERLEDLAEMVIDES